MKYIISVDPGKRKTKCVGRSVLESNDKEISFPTKYYDLNNGDIELQGNSYKVSYFECEEYILGEQGEIYDTSTTKTSFVHELSIYTAITAIAGKDTNPKVILTIGCPTAIYKNPDLKSNYRDLIMKDKLIEITVNDVDYKIELEKVIVRCEGSGIAYLEPNVFKGQRVAVVDLGGRNMNFGIYDNRVPVPSTLFSNNFGSTLLETMLREEFSIFYGDDYDLETAAMALKNGGLIINGQLDKDSALLVREVIDRYIKNHILNSIREKNINLSIMPVVAIGGTSKIIIDYLKKHIPHIQLSTVNAQWANVKGYQIVGLVKAGIV